MFGCVQCCGPPLCLAVSNVHLAVGGWMSRPRRCLLPPPPAASRCQPRPPAPAWRPTPGAGRGRRRSLRWVTTRLLALPPRWRFPEKTWSKESSWRALSARLKLVPSTKANLSLGPHNLSTPLRRGKLPSRRLLCQTRSQRLKQQKSAECLRVDIIVADLLPAFVTIYLGQERSWQEMWVTSDAMTMCL